MEEKKRDCEIYGYTEKEYILSDGSKCYVRTPNYPPERVKKCFDNFFQTVYSGNLYMERAQQESESYEGIPY